MPAPLNPIEAHERSIGQIFSDNYSFEIPPYQRRGLLAEYGIILPLHLSQLRRHLPPLFSEEHPLLSLFARELIAGLHAELCDIDERLQSLEHRIRTSFESNAFCQRIAAVEGVGPVIATAVVAAISDGKTFRNGRQFAAWLGTVPRQHSSGDKQRMLGITKRGERHLQECHPGRDINVFWREFQSRVVHSFPPRPERVSNRFRSAASA